MKLKLTYALFSTLFVLPSVCIAGGERTDASFHPPQTEAEKTLDTILKLNKNRDLDLYDFIFNYPDRNKAQDKQLSPFFSATFLQRHEEEEKSLIKESCGGAFPDNGHPCDMIRSINPVACAQDTPGTYLYRTAFQDGEKAIILYGWPENETYVDGPSYTLILSGNSWVLDKTSCEGEDASRSQTE